jgi:hypothetical protein
VDPIAGDQIFHCEIAPSSRQKIFEPVISCYGEDETKHKNRIKRGMSNAFRYCTVRLTSGLDITWS